MPADTAIGHVVLTLLFHGFEKLRRIRFWRLKLISRNAEIRVSFSALLRIANGGRYVLVRNLHRPEVFSPFGGVYKFYEGARGDLDTMLFRPQDVGSSHDMRNDLRGFLPRKNLGKFVKWFTRNTDRESAAECLNRELLEELQEIKLISTLPTLRPPSHLEVKKVRAVEEGPEEVPGRNYIQFRIFEVFDIIPHNADCLRFLEELVNASDNHPDLVLADSSDVVVGRCSDGRVIAHLAAYLVSKKRIRPDVAPFAGS